VPPCVETLQVYYLTQGNYLVLLYLNVIKRTSLLQQCPFDWSKIVQWGNTKVYLGNGYLKKPQNLESTVIKPTGYFFHGTYEQFCLNLLAAKTVSLPGRLHQMMEGVYVCSYVENQIVHVMGQQSTTGLYQTDQIQGTQKH